MGKGVDMEKEVTSCEWFKFLVLISAVTNVASVKSDMHRIGPLAIDGLQLPHLLLTAGSDTVI